MSSNCFDHDLLFGVIALQNHLVTPDDFISAVRTWCTDKAKPLAAIFRDQRTKAHRALVDNEIGRVARLKADHLEHYGGDIHKSLAALSTSNSIREELTKLRDLDVEASLGDLSVNANTLPLHNSQAGDTRFKILRHYKTGGLGEVFVALDSELGREVALKEIKHEQAQVPESQSRFIMEAEITGGLEHPGIVPVYGHGVYNDDRPYYAMRFIYGTDLTDAIIWLHTPALEANDYYSVKFRNFLLRFIDICNAIEYAHSRGVIHLDLKPRNIRFGRFDEKLSKFDEAVIIDWGLAKATEQGYGDTAEQLLRPASRNGPPDTTVGSAIGTPAYTSPEQATTNPLCLINPATDIYSLGATLYSILTGKQPFEGDDFEVLRKVRKGDFQTPREVCHSVPKPLDAICRKAMSRKEADRYQSAKALVADLDNWLAGEPVSVYRENLRERSYRWAASHLKHVERTALTGIVLLVLAITGCVVAYFAFNSEVAARKAKEEALGKAVAAGKETEAALERESTAHKQAVAAGERESAARRQAEDYYVIARKAVDRWLLGVSEALRYAPGMQNMRERLLLAACEDYTRFSQYVSEDPKLELERGRALLKLGEAQRDLGNFVLASTSFVSAETHFEELGHRLPSMADSARIEQARALKLRGNLPNEGNASTLWQLSINLLAEEGSSAEAKMERQLILAEAHIRIAEWHVWKKQTQLALQQVNNALAVLSKSPVEAPSSLSAQTHHLSFGRLEALRLRARIQMEESEEEWREAYESLVQAATDCEFQLRAGIPDLWQLEALAATHLEMAGLLRKLGLYEQELNEYGAALPAYRQVLGVVPDSLEYRESMAMTLLDRAQLLFELHQFSNAERDVDEALSIITCLASRYPQMARYQEELGVGLEAQGRLAHLAARHVEARDVLQRSVKLFEQLASSWPDVPQYRERAAVARGCLACVLSALGQAKQADLEFDSAISQLTELGRLAPDQLQLATSIVWLHTNRGRSLWGRGDKSRAEKEYEQAKLGWDEIMAKWRKLLEKWPASAHLRTYADLLANCPVERLRKPSEAVLEARLGRPITTGDILGSSVLASALYRVGNHKEALLVLNQYREGSYPLARDCFIRAMALQADGDPVAAQGSFDAGMVLQRQQRGDENLCRLAAEAANSLGITFVE